MLRDQRAILTVCAPQANIAGVQDVTVAMPHLLGGQGIIGKHHPLALSSDEQEKLHASAALIRGLIDELDGEEKNKL